MAKRNKEERKAAKLSKCPTGIKGLDEITGGGLPEGRPTLVCGSAGCGKTVFSMEFLVRGALQFNEPGVFMAFEETEADLEKNFSDMGFDLRDLVKGKKITMDHVRIDRSEIEETGEYNLEGLFVRLQLAIDQVGAKRVVLDTIESLFSGFTNEGILRSELRRLFRWLKNKGVTAIITAEQGKGTLTRHGLEEYVADCVMLLDHRIMDQISTRRLRIVKYRGSVHGADEYPFLIHENGISLLPITSIGLDHSAPTARVSTGIDRLDTMFGGAGYYRGSTILVSGSAGTGKTSISAHFVDSFCKRGERALFIAFEESPKQIIRNMNSIGIDLAKWVTKGLLVFQSIRPSQYGLESHLTRIHKVIEELRPSVVVIDPISNLVSVGNAAEVKTMLMRLIDFLKTNEITTMCNDLTPGMSLEQTEIGMSSLMDTWILLRSLESSGERNRTLYITKSRGMKHSDQIREFRLTDNGVELIDAYVGSGASGGLTGSARTARESEDVAEALARRQKIELSERELERKKTILQSQIALLQAQFDAEEEEIQKDIDEEIGREESIDRDRSIMAHLRKTDNISSAKKGTKNFQGNSQ